MKDRNSDIPRLLKWLTPAQALKRVTREDLQFKDGN